MGLRDILKGRPGPLALDYQAFSDQGGRESNQDFYGAELDPANGRYCFVLCDGLGGHRGGETASRVAVDFVLAGFPFIYEDNVAEGLANVFQAAHAAIRRQAEADPKLKGMGATGVVLMIFGRNAFWGHVGDSRLYVIRKGQVVHQSRDHSVVQLLVDMGEIGPEEMPHHPDRNRLLKTLGADDEIKPAFFVEGFPLESGDILVLCSDGYWEYIKDGELVRTLTLDKAGPDFARRAARNFDTVKKRAKAAKEDCDNLTAQFIRVE
ncbi:MAG: protein phosphatase 2C domain-containing protein [Thermodesulfobacteriota bacterium]